MSTDTSARSGMEMIRQQAFSEATAACDLVIAYYQRQADEAGARRERRVSPLLIRSGAVQCKSAIADVAAGRKLCERCSNPRWDIFTLCRECHVAWTEEQQRQITAPEFTA